LYGQPAVDDRESAMPAPTHVTPRRDIAGRWIVSRGTTGRRSTLLVRVSVDADPTSFETIERSVRDYSDAGTKRHGPSAGCAAPPISARPPPRRNTAMKNAVVTALSIAALAAAPATSAQTAPATVPAATYVIDSHHTLARFGVTHFGINEFFGTFPGATGTLTLDPRDLAATTLDVTLPVATVSTANATLDRELAGADWFDAARFPAMRFVSTRVTRTGARTATIAGNLTMHGVTKPIVLNATFEAAAINPMNKAYTLGFRATGVIRRTAFGVSKYAPMVSDDTTITISAAFEKKA
jgi:polyisoprenoid-binding protein YceI